jgi:hypothetical protein
MCTWARAELAAICSKLGRIPTKEEYLADMGVLTAASEQGLPVPEFRPGQGLHRVCGNGQGRSQRLMHQTGLIAASAAHRRQRPWFCDPGRLTWVFCQLVKVKLNGHQADIFL